MRDAWGQFERTAPYGKLIAFPFHSPDLRFADIVLLCDSPWYIYANRRLKLIPPKIHGPPCRGCMMRWELGCHGGVSWAYHKFQRASCRLHQATWGVKGRGHSIILMGLCSRVSMGWSSCLNVASRGNSPVMGRGFGPCHCTPAWTQKASQGPKMPNSCGGEFSALAISTLPWDLHSKGQVRFFAEGRQGCRR